MPDIVRGICVSTADNSVIQNVGRGGCQKVNPFKALSGVIFTTADFQFADAEAMADKANWLAGIKEGTIIPMPDLNTYTDESVEPTYNESERQKRTLTRQGDYRFVYSWNVPFDVHKKLQSLRNGNLRVFTFDEEGNMFGTFNGDAIQGLSLSMINPLKMNFVEAAAGAPALSHIAVDYNNEKEWNVFGATLAPSWDISDLEPLVDVTLEVVGTPTATSVVVRVYSSSGLSPDGTISKRAIAGIVEADFDVSLTGASSGITDNADGTYTIAGAAFATGTVNLKAPTAMTSTFGSLIIVSTGAVAVTIAT